MCVFGGKNLTAKRVVFSNKNSQLAPGLPDNLRNEKFWKVVRKKFFAKNCAPLVVVELPQLAA